MTTDEVLKLLIDQTKNNGLILGKYELIYHDESDFFTLCDDNGGTGGTANEILNYLK
tara:strand:+ start:856 stop:1026 length:171 start_codon:yes stop_codon:yes gene_type:complete